MKFKIKGKKFKPVKVTITFETLKELAGFCKRLNVDPSSVDRYSIVYLSKFYTKDLNDFSLWKSLDTIVKKAIDEI